MRFFPMAAILYEPDVMFTFEREIEMRSAAR